MGEFLYKKVKYLFGQKHSCLNNNKEIKKNILEMCEKCQSKRRNQLKKKKNTMHLKLFFVTPDIRHWRLNH